MPNEQTMTKQEMKKKIKANEKEIRKLTNENNQYGIKQDKYCDNEENIDNFKREISFLKNHLEILKWSEYSSNQNKNNKWEKFKAKNPNTVSMLKNTGKVAVRVIAGAVIDKIIEKKTQKQQEEGFDHQAANAMDGQQPSTSGFKPNLL